MLPLKVAGLGVYLPERRETREDFIKRGIPEQIIEDLGVYERRIVADGQTAADMEVEAARVAIKNAGLTAEDIDLIMSATILPEMIGIPNSNLLQHRIGAINAAAFDVGQACGTAIPAMILAGNFITLRQYRRILLTASTNWSVISNPAQASADFVLGDGAAAVVLELANPGYGILSFEMEAAGEFYFNCGIRIGHDKKTNYYDRHNDKLLFYIDQGGLSNVSSRFSRHLLSSIPSNFGKTLRKANLTSSDISCVLIHGGVKPLADAWIKRMKVSPENFPLTYHRYGNLSVATVLVNLHEGLNKGMIKQGDTIALVAQGAGFSTGTIIMRWE